MTEFRNVMSQMEKAAMEVVTTRGKKINFRSLVNGTKLPRMQRCRGKLYAVTILERNPAKGMVRIHYEGYSSDDDEWRSAAEIVDVSTCSKSEIETSQVCREPLLTPTFSLYQELAMKIKSSLISTKKGSPEVKVIMGFDKIKV